MEFFFLQWGILVCSLSCFHLFPLVESGENIKAVNLGGWLVVEGYLTPELFDSIPNKNMLDGTQVRFRSLALNKFVVAENGGGSTVTVRSVTADTWETFKLWRISENKFQFRSLYGQFLSCDNQGVVSAEASSDDASTFDIRTTGTDILTDGSRVHIKHVESDSFLQATDPNTLVANNKEEPGWDDNMATFELIIISQIQGEYQIGNGYGVDQATEILQNHRSTFVTEDDFKYLSGQGINTVRIPVGWWIASDPIPPAPYVGGSLDALDNAFLWAENNGLRCIIDLHAAPGSQNAEGHSGTRDGFAVWATSEEDRTKSLDVISFLAYRYASRIALLGIELLNEPNCALVPLDILVEYYKSGYQRVREHSETAFVIICQRIAARNQFELYDQFTDSSSYPKLVVDLHWYTVFDKKRFKGKPAADNIGSIYDRKAQVVKGNSTNGLLLFIGEWTNAMHHDAKPSPLDYQNFGKIQLEVYSQASFGWAFWSLKNTNRNQNIRPWDFMWNIENGYLQLGGTTNR